jgi:hypothetical protein
MTGRSNWETTQSRLPLLFFARSLSLPSVATLLTYLGVANDGFAWEEMGNQQDSDELISLNV